ncbi:MAG TPA: hypothetical protein VJJ83_00265 [Candidatus Babeliales bacterium]|nr:hypothetical protein [Candidatus Babeliales bacterium]
MKKIGLLAVLAAGLHSTSVTAADSTAVMSKMMSVLQSVSGNQMKFQNDTLDALDKLANRLIKLEGDVNALKAASGAGAAK